MEYKNSIKWIATFALLSTLLSACGGGGSKIDTTAPNAPSDPSFNRLTGGKITVSGTAEAGSTIKITFSDNSVATILVPSNGQYSVTTVQPFINESSSQVLITATDTSGNISETTTATLAAPESKTGKLTAQLSPTVALIGVSYTTSLYNHLRSTLSDGSYNYKQGETVSFTIAGNNYTVSPKPVNTEQDLLGTNSNADTIQNLKLILVNLDKDANANNGIDLSDDNANIDSSLSTSEVTKLLYKATGNMPKLLFSPSLGINTEAPQAEADTAGQAMPFVDIFKTARPFKELSKASSQTTSDAEFDENGWQTKADSIQGYGRTKLLQGTLKGAIPSGKYTLLYDGNGKVELGGKNISQVKGLSNHQGFTFEFNLQELDFSNPAAEEENVLNLNVKNIAPGEGNYIKNIRIIMPGGTCKHSDDTHNPFIRVESQLDCPQNTTYESFFDQIIDKSSDDIESIIFNPDYLSFLREFKVVRMMNMMESSHGRTACQNDQGIIDNDCINEAVDWADRAKISDAVWGGSGRTAHTERNGVPVEVLVSLANTLNRDIWVNMPHYADDNYIHSFSKHLADNLNNSIKTYIEYSNETWNPGFIGHFYVENKGIEAGYNTVPAEFIGFRDEAYFARLRFYSKRSVEIFEIFKEEFNDSTDRLVRVLGTNQGDKVLSEQMLKYDNNESKVDAIAMAPYFFGCSTKENSCIDAPKVLKDAKTVDDVFDIIDQSKTEDPSALASTIKKIKAQASITQQYNVQLLSYEGGQHLTTSVMGNVQLNETEKAEFRELFKAANRDPRMKQRYETLLNAWKGEKDNGATLFTLYTQAQSYYRFGNWGLKEHLNQSRADAPKYDAVMGFQESVGSCWWDACEP